MICLVTGSAGFIGRHLVEALSRRPGITVIGYDLGASPEVLEHALAQADVIFHLAGINRPQDPVEFKTGNVDFTAELCARLSVLRPPASDRRPPTFVLSSSIQAVLDNPYGVSKRQSEEAVQHWAADGHGQAVIFRLKNVFGKWCRPNYNSVTATFCNNIAHDLPITISDPTRELELVYIDDVVEAFLGVLPVGPTRDDAAIPGGAESDSRPPTPDLRPRVVFAEVPRSYRVTLGDLAERIRSFRESRRTLRLPDFSDPLNRCLYATYLSYLDGPEFAYLLEQKTDPRGSLAEFVKSPGTGQIFVSRTKPGVTRGNHYHHTKTEKFLVVEGEAVIRFRRIPAACGPAEAEIIEHRVSGNEFRVVDIPPGYTHSIENVGAGELVTLFWASEIFDPARPDTVALPVLGM